MVGSFGERLRESLDAFKAVFTNPGLLRVELGWGFAITAYWAFIIALSVYAYDEGGAAAVGLVGLVRVLPAFVAAPFAGMLGDRYRRERVMFVLSLGRAVSMGATAAAIFAGSPIWLVYTLAGAVALSASMVRPMQSALLPQLARTPEELTAANLVVTTIESSGIFLGPAIGGLLLAATNTETVFAAAAGSFALAALLVAGIKVEGLPERELREGGFFREFFAGFGAIGGDRNLRLIIGLYGAQTLIAGALNVLLVVAALELLNLGEAGVGFLNSAVGVGGLFGALAAFALVGRQRLASDFGLGLVLWGFPIALIGVWPNPTIALILLGLVGVGNTVVDVAALTLLQRTVPDEVLTRVFGVVQSVFVATLGLGAIAAPLMTGTIGIRWAMVVTGSILPVLAGLLWRRIRALDAEALAPTRELALLRAIPLFKPLPAPAIDQLASHLIPLQATVGDEIVRQGEPGHRFYVIAAGEVEVLVDGRPGGVFGPGDHFGEIALLRDVPRTATVKAKTDTELYALERDEFLSAVTGHAASAEAADAIVASRLAGLRPGIASV
ncbi:MAG TPA: MFS transporter [Gaiellaceae bacterium]|nr:MFS transporter [Gaiellaceae bacterium]